MPEKVIRKARAHTELRRQDQARPDAADPEAEAKSGTEAEVAKLKPRTPDDRVPGGDEDDLFNDMPV